MDENYRPKPESYAARADRIGSEAISLHQDKARDYGDAGDHLGIKGQYAELWRKIGKLKGPMWDDRQLTFEQPVEILQDLIGHCIKAIDYYQQEEKK